MLQVEDFSIRHFLIGRCLGSSFGRRLRPGRGPEGAFGQEEDDGEGKRGRSRAGQERSGDGMTVGVHQNGVLRRGNGGHLLDAKFEEGCRPMLSTTPEEIGEDES